MPRTALPLVTALLLCACPKTAPAPVDPAEQVLGAWARTQLDLRTWRSCARSAEHVDLEQAVLVFAVAADGAVSPLVIEPEESASDAAIICLGFELAKHPTSVAPHGEARVIRIRAGTVHEQPGGGI